MQGDYNNGVDARDAWIVPAAEGDDCRVSPNPTPAGGITWCPLLPIVLQPSPNTNQKGSFSASDFVPAACLFTGIALTDLLLAAGEAPPPLGLYANPQGGTTIEAWLPLELSASSCVNATCLCNWPTPGWTNCPIYQPLNASCANGGSYHAKSQSLFNMTVAAMLFYQGENNMMFDAGADPSTGYTCMLKTLVAHYREMWSVVPGTTDPMLPFYIVNLHDGAEEGWGGMMAAMTYAHTAGYGSLPNALLPNAHFVQAFDAGDAWDGGEACATSLCCVGTEFLLGPACEGDFRGHWTNDTVDGGGFLHPRTKDVPGARLAQAIFAAQYAKADSPVLGTGPVIAGCTVAGGTLTLIFDAGLLKNERVTVSKPPLADPLNLTLENTCVPRRSARAPSGRASARALDPRWRPALTARAPPLPFPPPRRALYVLVNATLPAFDGHNPCNYATVSVANTDAAAEARTPARPLAPPLRTVLCAPPSARAGRVLPGRLQV